MTDIIDEPWDEEAEAEFVDTLLKQFVPRLENRITLLNLGGGSISELMNRQRKQFEEFDLLFRGLSDVEKERMLMRLAPQWRILTELMAQSQALAKRQLSRRAAH